MKPFLTIILLLTITVAKGQDKQKNDTTIYEHMSWPIPYCDLATVKSIPEILLYKLNGNWYRAYDTIPVVFTAQYCKSCAIVWRDGYLIGGQPYVVRKGRLIKVQWYRWEVKEIKSK